jgi:hypothetical protein
MATTKKKSAPKKTAAKKVASAKKSVKAKVSAKSAPKAKATKATTAKAKNSTRPAGPREQKLASTALKLVDEAASLLRKGISTTADTSEKARLDAKKKAHNLLTKAHSSLSDVLSGGTSALHKIIGKV